MVNELANDTFFARIHLQVDGRDLEIDSRPSDAIALAVRAAAPIFAEDAVLDQAGVTVSEEQETAQVEEGGQKRTPPPVREDELKKMSAFREFVQGLDLDDFRPARGGGGGLAAGPPDRCPRPIPRRRRHRGPRFVAPPDRL